MLHTLESKDHTSRLIDVIRSKDKILCFGGNMGQYIRTTANAPCICAWKCIYCDSMNVEQVMVSVSTQQSYGLIGVKKDDARKNTSKASLKGVQEAIDQANHTHQIPSAVSIRGKCRQCKKSQPWAIVRHLHFLRTVISVILSILVAIYLRKFLTSLVSPLTEKQSSTLMLVLIIVASIAAGYGFWRGSGFLLNRYCAKKMSNRKRDYYPLIHTIPK